MNRTTWIWIEADGLFNVKENDSDLTLNNLPRMKLKAKTYTHPTYTHTKPFCPLRLVRKLFFFSSTQLIEPMS